MIVVGQSKGDGLNTPRLSNCSTGHEREEGVYINEEWLQLV